jgi:hypothetical protein
MISSLPENGFVALFPVPRPTRSRIVYPFVIATGDAKRGGRPNLRSDQMWNDAYHLIVRSHPGIWSTNMGEVIQFVSKAERERARLIRKARAIYDSIFPPADLVSEQRDPKIELAES